MPELIQIYKLSYDNIKLVLPTINDVKVLIKENEWLFAKLLLNELKITPLQVLQYSKMHETAIDNTLIDFSNVPIKT